MHEINLYIETSIHGPTVADGAYGYVIEYRKKNKSLVTREGFGRLEQATENQLALTALKRALERLTKPCSIRAFIGCVYIKKAFENGWMQAWKVHNWENSKGEPVKYTELWKEAAVLLEPHNIEFAPEADKNEYRVWLQEEMQYQLEQDTV